MISQLEKLLGTPRDGALLRYSLGLEYAKAGDQRHARSQYLRDAVERDPLYSAAWKVLGKALAESGTDRGGARGLPSKASRRRRRKATVRPRRK